MSRFPIVVALLAALTSHAGAFAPQQDPTKDDQGEVGVSAGSLAKKVSFPLELQQPADGERRFASRSPAVITLAAKPPLEIRQRPRLHSETPLYGMVRFGRGGKQLIILDQSVPASHKYDLLWIDRDRDQSFGSPDEAEPIQGVLAHDEQRDLDYVEFTASPITVYYGVQVASKDGSDRIEDSCRFTFYTWQPRSGHESDMTTLYTMLASWREGSAKLAGKDARIVLFDDSGTAMYAVETSHWALLELAPGAPLPKDLTLTPCSVPIEFRGVPYRITSLMPEARRIDITEESVDSARQALLDSDPTQLEPPRVRADKDVEWLSDFAAAQEAAKKTKKPICILYTADWSSIAKTLDERTLSDAEVSELLRTRFVCVKLNPALTRTLAAKHEATIVPTMVFIDTAGDVIERVVGYRQARSLADVLRRTRG